MYKTSLAPTGQKRKRIREMCQTSEIFGRQTTVVIEEAEETENIKYLKSALGHSKEFQYVPKGATYTRVMWDTADFMYVCKCFRLYKGQEVITGSVKIGKNYI